MVTTFTLSGEAGTEDFSEGRRFMRARKALKESSPPPEYASCWRRRTAESFAPPSEA